MHKQRKTNRRKFLQGIGLLLTIPFLYAWYSVTKVAEEHRAMGKLDIPLPSIPEGLSFHPGVIILKNDDQYTVLSSRCTHLGCTISETTDGKLVCPCHGSMFDLSGQVLKGPSNKALKTLPFTRNVEKGIISIELLH